MPAVRPCDLPPGALLERYAEPDLGGYTDCFVIDAPGAVSLPDFVEAFYSSPVFKPELMAVGLLFRRPWAGERARRLARGEDETFSAWRVEARTDDQLLMYETISGKTRSWLMARPHADGQASSLYFGTAILPVGVNTDGRPRMSALFAPFAGGHRLYSRLLLRGALQGLA